MQMKNRYTTILLFLVGGLVLTACAGSGRYRDLRLDEPSPYYLRVPERYSESERWPLFIALHDVNEDSYDCIEEWFEIADENDIFLLCPELSGEGEAFDQSANERILADILNAVYQEYSLRSRFFLAGRGEAASFALSYASRYPQAIDGVSAIEAERYPSGADATTFPILIIVEQGDQEAMTTATTFMESMGETGGQARLLEIDNLGRRIPFGVMRLTVDLFEQVSR
jgi:hypothetical protein